MADVAGDAIPLGAVEAAGDEDGAPVLRLTGEIDISNAEPLGDALEAIVGPDARRLVVDLEGLEFMDSAGIAMLLRTASRVDAVEIRNPSEVMRRIIECTGLTGIFRVTG
jgi:anti-sigma B factor antagonist